MSNKQISTFLTETLYKVVQAAGASVNVGSVINDPSTQKN